MVGIFEHWVADAGRIVDGDFFVDGVIGKMESLCDAYDSDGNNEA